MKGMLTACRLALSLWAGGNALFTFVLTPLIFRNETRDTAARIVGYLFPWYFRWGLACGVVALVFLLAARRGTVTAAVLAVLLAVTAFQALYIEPRAAELKRQIGSFEATTKEHPLRREFSRLHAVSAVCNLGVVGGGIVLLVIL